MSSSSPSFAPDPALNASALAARADEAAQDMPESFDPETPSRPSHPAGQASDGPARRPVSALAEGVLDLFAGPLAEVRFPNVDRQVLEEAEDALVSAQVRLEEAERALEQARQSVAGCAGALDGLAQQALAYARVFSAHDPALSTRLETLAGGGLRPGHTAALEAPRKRGRPRGSTKRGAGPESATMLFAGSPDGAAPLPM